MSHRVAIIGCGYVGAELGAELVRCGHDVLGTTTTAARQEELQRRGMTADIVEMAEVERLHDVLADRQVAYLTVAPRAERSDYRRVYLAGVENLLHAARGSAVRRIVYTSSTSVYGQDDGSWVDEDSPTEPTTENGRILVDAERALLSGAAPMGIAATVVRLAGIYGPGRDPAIRAARLAGQERDDGDAYVNLIHRDDIVAALLRLLDVPHHGTLNLCNDRPVLRRELYDRLIGAAGLPPIRWRTAAAPTPRGKRVRNDRIKRLLGLALVHAAYDGG